MIFTRIHKHDSTTVRALNFGSSTSNIPEAHLHQTLKYKGQGEN